MGLEVKTFIPAILFALTSICAARAVDDCFPTVFARAAGAPVLAAEGGWLYLASELRFLAAGDFWGDAAADTGRAVNPAHRDPLEPIDDFNRQLTDMNIRLLVVPVPPKALIYPAPLGCTRETARPAMERLRRFYSLLRERGVQVLDLSEDFLQPAALAEGELYCKTDSHWSGLGVQRAAKRIAEWIRAQEGVDLGLDSSSWKTESRERQITGDLTRMMRGSESEPLILSFVEDLNGQPARSDSSSPILLLGDSHVLVFSEGGDMHANGAGLPDHLAAALGRSVDVLGVRGSGATTSRITFMRRIKAAPDSIVSKKLVIWCFAAREFTEADAWRFVPLPPL